MGEVLSEKEHWYRLVLETAFSAFVSMDSEGNITDWNPRAEEIFGWKREEAIGRKLAATIIPPSYREAHSQGFKRYLATGETKVINKVIEMRGLHRDGHEFPVELTIATAPINNQVHFFAFLRDISERKRLEGAEKQREELQRSNAELERFAHITSHDLQEPLRTVSMYTQILAVELKDVLTPEQAEYVRHIVCGTERMQRLIKDLLSFSRVTSKAIEKLEKVKVETALGNALQDLEVNIRSSNAKIVFESLPEVMGNPVQICQLLLNLIGNAIKFKSDKPPIIQISAKRDGDFWAICVKDNGIGFEKEYSESIFEMFRRLHPNDKYPGTGMGLAICKKIVDLHGGRIWAESIPGQGAAFYFTLPASEPQLVPKLAGMRILAVDDSASERSLLFIELQGTGAKLEMASSGKEAIQKARAENFDLILMDIEMPGINGIDAAKEISRAGVMTPIVGYSGHDLESVKERIPKKLFSDYLSKSMNPHALANRLYELRQGLQKVV